MIGKWYTLDDLCVDYDLFYDLADLFYAISGYYASYGCEAGPECGMGLDSGVVLSVG